MPSCYLCGLHIPRGQELRRPVHTGATIAGFNLSSNVPLNWFLNSLLFRRLARIRNSYSLVTICPACAINLDEQERRRMRTVFYAATSTILLIIAFLLLSTVSR